MIDSGHAIRDTEGDLEGQPPYARKRDELANRRRAIVILDETAGWALRDRTGKVVAWAASLRMALIMASGRGREGYKAPALTMEPNDHIIVYRAQIERLIKVGD